MQLETIYTPHSAWLTASSRDTNIKLSHTTKILQLTFWKNIIFSLQSKRIIFVRVLMKYFPGSYNVSNQSERFLWVVLCSRLQLSAR